MNQISETTTERHNDILIERPPLRFFWWLRNLVYFWVKSNSIPREPKDYQWDPKKPVCYVLNLHSVTDLLVLDYHCEKLKLPRPRMELHDLSHPGDGAYVYLSKSGIFQKQRSKPIPTGLMRLLKKAQDDKVDIQLIPVSVFWGRNAGREEKSLFKMLFFDDEQGGWFQRLILFFVQGRNVFCSFGKPISLVNYLEQEKGKEILLASKKLRRVLRVHFHRQRESIVGPYLYDRRHMVHSILTSKSLRQLFDQETNKKNKSREKVEQSARRYIDEIAADLSPHVVHFMETVLSWVFRKIYRGIDIQNGEMLRNLAETHEIVYLPCHRSHMDYLLLSYSLYHLGVSVPHTAAGVNLNFWPIGTLFRRGGAFFIRRSFAGNKLYSAVFSEYVSFLLTNGYSMCFYIEGGRSRTGRLLQPKLGMLNMVVKSFQENSEKPILLVPAFISYDKLMEARSYFHELKGKAKKAESIWQLFRMPKLLGYEFGKAYISFGQPIDLQNYLEEIKSSQSESVAHLSKTIMTRINCATQVTPIALFSTAMLSLPKRAITEKQLVLMVNTWLDLLRKLPYDSRTFIPEGDAKDFLKSAEALAQVHRFEHIAGDVIFVNDKDCAFLNYYRNNLLPLFIVPSLIANTVSLCESISMNSVIESVTEFYLLLRNDFFLKWDQEQIKAVIRSYVETMQNLNLLSVSDEKINAPIKDSEEYFHVECLGRVIGNIVERYCLYLSVLSESTKGMIDLDSYLKNCENSAKKSSILNGYHEFDYIDKNEHKQFLDSLIVLNYVKKTGNLVEVLDKTALCLKNIEPIYTRLKDKRKPLEITNHERS